jgi:hypothetical protein
VAYFCFFEKHPKLNNRPKGEKSAHSGKVPQCMLPFWGAAVTQRESGEK